MVLVIIVVPMTINDVEAQQAGDQYRARATRTDVAPLLDGILEQGVWGPAGLINELIQQEPVEGAPATEDTEIYLLYDAQTLLLKNTVEHRSNVCPSSSCSILVACLLRLYVICSDRHDNYAEHHGAGQISQQDRH